MNKKELVASMRTFVGGGDFISPTEITKWRRISRNTLPELLEGLTPLGKSHKMYFIPEVAEKVIERKV